MAVSLVSTGVTFPDNSTQTTAATGFGFKNRIINGAMVIDQRNAGASITANNSVYGVDRWKCDMVASSKGTIQQTPSATETGYATRVAAGFSSYLAFTSSAATSLAAGDYYSIIQAVEGLNISDLAWGTANAKTVTLSFLVYSSLTGTFGGAIQNSAYNRSYPFSYTISSANTWTSISITIAGDQSGTWLTTNGAGLRVRFSLGTGTTYSGTAGAWVGSDIESVTGATSVVGTSGATFYITGVQLEKGSTATSFDYRPYGTELALCQRYYQQYDASENGASGAGLVGVCGATNTGVMSGLLPVAMRTTATVAFNNLVLNYGAATVGVSSITVYSAQKAVGMDITTSTSPMTVGRACVLQFTGGAGSANKITYSAEL